jgi:hypothetical protein
MGNADCGINDDINILHVCDREGDNYELFDQAFQSGQHTDSAKPDDRGKRANTG